MSCGSGDVQFQDRKSLQPVKRTEYLNRVQWWWCGDGLRWWRRRVLVAAVVVHVSSFIGEFRQDKMKRVEGTRQVHQFLSGFCQNVRTHVISCSTAVKGPHAAVTEEIGSGWLVTRSSGSKLVHVEGRRPHFHI